MLEISRHHLAAQMIDSSATRSGLPSLPPFVSSPRSLTDSAVPLPPPADVPNPVGAIETRRSGLSPGDLRVDALSALLLATTATALSSLQPAAVPRPGVFPLVRRVSGIRPGAYRHEPSGHLLVPIDGARNGSDHAVMLQDDHERAAAVLVFAAPLAAWLRHAGDRGYRAAALAIGYLTDRLYLVAEALGLSYTASGGFSPPVMDRLLGLDGYHEVAFFSFVLGGPRR